MPATPPFPAPALSSASELLADVLFVSLTGVLFYQPVYAPDSQEIIDFQCVRLNPAAQRMLELPEHAGWTLLAQYPHSRHNGVFAYYCQAFQNEGAERFDVNYQADRLDNFFHLAARRSGQLLVVSFTDTADQDRSNVEQTLRESHARERQARAEAETQRQRLHDMLMQLPVCIAIYVGPNMVYDLVNPYYQQLFPERTILGLPLSVALPELKSQGVYEELTRVYRTGKPYYNQEQETWVDFTNSGQLQKRYFNVFFQALRDAEGSIYGLLNFAYDVTEQVQARQQVEQLNQEQAIINEELQVANEEYSLTNVELVQTQRELRNLNQELEARIQKRTTQVAAALRKAEQQGQLLEQQKVLLQHILSQVPASIATLTGPEHRYTFFNSSYHVLSGQRAQYGLPVSEAIPEIGSQGFVHLLDRVYSTGEPYVGIEVPVQLRNPASNTSRQQYIDFVYQPLVTAEGKTQGILAFIVDATDKVLARREVERSQELLQLALTAGQMGTWHLDLRTNTSERSLQHDQLFGYTEPQPEWGQTGFGAT
ncbi:PAS domain-containing protein [Hymenobacter sp. 5516J-16]|uniref:PAS domain-containing protein n=1 Tax=Hymenobacter sp. 5516J-16 TaxID=2932253 RepID=UPI001FD4A623|nr:PAS domain-containing protein [Hymenobacter sp. 5516J-16]UOQ76936.1 PAS domain-containing protein [Hymenobacter sp. 5516J-16]